ncbi:hypothetical protein [Peterkaempfera sp. SMS 1(5)a]|uniref:hypothetical protein n=1 Tax=Peterkaempfera podocarpi TaxID=3232308 RepID=UPI00366B6AD9
MGEITGSSVSGSWRRVDAWLAVHAPETLALLNPPAAPTARQATQACGHDGWTAWKPTAFPELVHTVRWRWE